MSEDETFIGMIMTDLHIEELSHSYVMGFYKDFLMNNKKVYDDTRLFLRFKELHSKNVEKIDEYRLSVVRYWDDEIHYKNRGVNMDLHSKLPEIEEKIYLLEEDNRYLESRMESLEIDMDIYRSYMEFENILDHFEKNT